MTDTNSQNPASATLQLQESTLAENNVVKKGSLKKVSEPQLNITAMQQPCHVTLTKNSKGYSWEISVHAEDAEKTLALIDEMNEQLLRKYGSTTKEES